MIIMGHGIMRAGDRAVAESHILFLRQREKKRETEGEGLRHVLLKLQSLLPVT